ncbi:hypothetical protein JQ596_38965 [Bradyrhizobium manausense]|uniref:hypothetical protein n=1 Tax=Bradyrhizobium TaxID=374 RepID=UPI001BA50777|nr:MULTISPECIES: hypothetical protein [Bradyrhizobium]MBR0831504.1 hypothetical protein [Bradyrhizobium manausense]UVO27095.1 hypothetical protein KUF59_31900 [Bradyrhizobium arachidis]
MSNTKTGFVDSLMESAKENPLAAILVGGGALWLLAGNEGVKRAARSATAAATPVVDAVQSAGTIFERSPPTAPDMNEDEVSFDVGAAVRRAGTRASDAMSEAAGKAKERLDEGISSARDALPGKQSFEKAQSSLADALERQPLLIGVVGLAIGAAVAGVFRRSHLEDDLMGQFSDQVKADLGTRTEAVTQSLREASDTLKAELGDLGEEALDRAKQAGLDAMDAARQATRAP